MCPPRVTTYAMVLCDLNSSNCVLNTVILLAVFWRVDCGLHILPLISFGFLTSFLFLHCNCNNIILVMDKGTLVMNKPEVFLRSNTYVMMMEE